MASAVLGKVSPTPKGEYVSTQDYDRLDVVTYEGYPYLAKSNVPSSNLPTDELYWMPLLTGLDFAPGGYGLGVTAYELPYIADANVALQTGWYRIDISTANGVGASGVMRVDAYSDASFCQTIYSGTYSSAYPVILERWYRNGWDAEWSWVNPPLMANVEYRTTERVDGKAVYKKRDSNGKILYRLDGSSTWIEGLPGAAPSGYGLGAFAQTTITDCNEANKNGWYATSSTCANQPWTGGGWLLVEALNNFYVIQYISTEKNGCVTCRRIKDNNVWGAWEYVNPPMSLGVEYRTTERYLGMPVYVKMIDFGALPYGTRKNVAHGITGKNYNVRSEIRVIGTGQLLEYKQGITEVIANATDVYITTDSDFSMYSVYFALWYAK